MNIDKLIKEFESNPDNGKAMYCDRSSKYTYVPKFVKWLADKIPEPEPKQKPIEKGDFMALVKNNAIRNIGFAKYKDKLGCWCTADGSFLEFPVAEGPKTYKIDLNKHEIPKTVKECIEIGELMK